MDYQDQLFILLDVAIASILASLIEIERESGDKPAGIRTNSIIGGVSCLIISLVNLLTGFIRIL